MKLLTVKEAAELLRVKPSTVYAWAEQRLMEGVYKINGALRINEHELIDWIASCEVTETSCYTGHAGKRPRIGGQ